MTFQDAIGYAKLFTGVLWFRPITWQNTGRGMILRATVSDWEIQNENGQKPYLTYTDFQCDWENCTHETLTNERKNHVA